MELKRQWCDHKTCPDFGNVAAGNLKVVSYVEHRYYCTTCRRTFSEDKHTFFETVRSPRPVVLEALALLNERNRLRAVARLTQHSPNRVLHWLDLAGRHAAAVSSALIWDLHLTQVQIDELWTFVKKNKPTVSPMIRRRSATCGWGGRWRCRAGCGW
jgi:transposase-like protein